MKSTVYDINSFAYYLALNMPKRDRLTDWYDAIELINNHYDELLDTVKSLLRSAFKSKNLDYFKYLLNCCDNTDEFYLSLETALNKLGGISYGV